MGVVEHGCVEVIELSWLQSIFAIVNNNEHTIVRALVSVKRKCLALYID